ncbi:MAG: alanine--glyoxylate aminotransferase family protein, partial [Acidobacteria bacterium]|nr:alanine--glyoxylate aminotransferase family protein [Acidobacteriota bacterium]
MKEFNPPKRILMGPGPSDVDPRVLSALSAPLVGHLDPAFLGVMDDIQQLLRMVFETGNRLTIPISATGSAGMEAAFVNLVEPGDPVVVCVNGVFGERMSDIVTRCGGKLTRVEAQWGRGFDMEEVRQALRRTRPGILAAVQAETSTGVLTPPARLREVLREFPETLLLLDCVTSLGGHPVEIDRHGVDFAYSGTQKCLSCPPGLAPITVSERAVERIRRRTTKVQSWYLDLTMVEKYWGDDRTYHHTAPVSMNYALRESLRLVVEEGLRNRFDRHRLNHRALVAGVEAMGLEMLVPPEDRLWVLNTVRVPDGISDAAVRSRLLSDFGIEIGGGLGPLKDRIWRVGLMGASSQANNVLMLLNALERILGQEGFR